MPAALVTGSEGFVGKRLCARLSGQGWEVRGIDILVPDDAPMRMACDITDRDQVDHVFEWAVDVTHVFHLAAVTFLPDFERDPVLGMKVNVGGGINLLQAARDRLAGARFVYVGSSEVYGHPQFLPLTEQHPLNPSNPYAISKAAFDHFCAYLHNADGMDIVTMRPFNHSGPGQVSSFVLPNFARQVALIEQGKAEPVLHVGNLEAVRDFSHVDDVIRGYESAALKGLAGEAYNVCSGQSFSIQEVLDRLRTLARADITVEVDRDRLRASDVPAVYGSHAKLAETTGWASEHSFDELLEDLLEYWRGRISEEDLPA